MCNPRKPLHSSDAAELIDALRIRTITIGELVNRTQSLQHIDRIALTIDWLRNVINYPFSAAIRGVEGAYRASAEVAESHEWETASVWPTKAIAADMPRRVEPVVEAEADADAVEAAPVPHRSLRPATMKPGDRSVGRERDARGLEVATLDVGPPTAGSTDPHIRY